MDRTLAADEGSSAADRTMAAEQGLAATLFGAARGAAGEDEVPAKIGRHLVLGRLGAGAMGVVYAAYDPELDRRLAIKVLVTTRSGGEDVSAARQRIGREAQAMARVTHPNVVQIFDVGAHGGRIYLAMELIDGETLAAWLARERRSSSQIVEVFTQAGRGLAAAHAAGLVHRDFKPENVLVDRQGRVRVADFGLARASAAAAMSPVEVAAGSERASVSLADDVTRGAGLVGTPAYMAPEVLRGQATDARSDVFAFSVALYEALYGRRPFHGETLAALFDAILNAEVATPPTPRVPAWLRRVVLRGLAREPRDRFATMDALLAALVAAPARRRRLVAAVGGAALLAGAALAGEVGTQRQTCEHQDAPLAGVWDEPRKAALSASFRKSDRPYAAPAWEGVARALDAYAAAWTAMRTDACEAAQVRGEQSLALMDRRMACLDERLLGLRRLLEVIEESDVAVADAAPAIVAGLRPLERCADAAALLADVAPPEDPAVVAAVARERERLVRSRSLETVGRTREAEALAAEVVAVARELGYGPLLAEALATWGHLRRVKGDGDSTALLREAYSVAEREGYERGRLLSAIEMISAMAPTPHLDPTGTWSLIAGALVGRNEDPELTPLFERHSGVAAYFRDDFEAAEQHFRRAQARYRELYGERHPDVAAMLSNIGGVYAQMARWDEAEATLRQSAAILEAEFGEAHPQLANTLQNLSAVLSGRGRTREAALVIARELSIREAVLGASHPVLRERWCDLGTTWLSVGEAAPALAAFDRCLEQEARYPSGLVSLRIHLARCDLLAGRDEAARRASCDRALALALAASEDTTPSSADGLLKLLLTVRGATSDAREPALLAALDVAAAGARGLRSVFEEIRVELDRADLFVKMGRVAEADALRAAARARAAEIADPGERGRVQALIASKEASPR